MHRSRPIFYNALMLTGVNLLLRAVGTTFHVYLSRRIGASGLGLLQLVMSVGNLAMVAGIAGIRTAAMYLTAEELGKSRPENVSHALSSCFVYSILCSCTVSAGLYFAAPFLAENWIGNRLVVPSLRLFAAFLPIVCLCGVMSGYFTAANRIGTLAIIEVIEQICSMLVTLAALTFWAGQNPERACAAIILGSSMGNCLTLAVLLSLRAREKAEIHSRFPIQSRLLHTAVPLAMADVLRSGIGTTENLMVPKRLSLYIGVQNPLSAFGQVSGMVFPVMMFPACILFALAELLIPELARCHAAGSKERIRHLVTRGLWAAMLYGVLFGGLIFLYAVPVCTALYHNADAGIQLRHYSILIPFLYCDALTDAMTKGLGQQKHCVKYNILTSGMDVLFLYFLLPRFGMKGYFASFLITHLLNFGLSLRRLILITDLSLPFHIPAFTAAAAMSAAWLSRQLSFPLLYLPLLFLLLYLFGIIRKEDARWLGSLTSPGLPFRPKNAHNQSPIAQ